MKKIKIFLLAVAAILVTGLLTACSADMPDRVTASNGITYSEDGNLIIPVSMDIPGMQKVSTRASLGSEPDYENLKLYLLVFETGKGLTQFTTLTTEPDNADSDHGHNNLVSIKSEIELQPTGGNVSFHLIATNQPDFADRVGYGTEERVITSLTTRNGYEAYWQRLDPECNIPGAEYVDPSNPSYDAREAAKAEKIQKLFKHIPMVRNFCSLSANSSAVMGNFLLTGVYLVNTVDCGYVAPYVAENPSSERFVKYYNNPAAPGQEYQPKSYKEISAQNHIGVVPGEARLINTGVDPAAIATKSESSVGDIQPIYFYERLARPDSRERSYVIIRGSYQGHADTYYKLDLGNVGDSELGIEVGLFEYYNLLRNFDYVINLKRVEGDGYSTFEEAAHGAIYNNFSAALEVRSMATISDGEDYMYLNKTSFVFTKADETQYLKMQYREHINDGLGGEICNDLIKLRLESGNVIKNIELDHVEKDKDDEEWYVFRMDGFDPTDDLLEQTLYLYRGNKGTEDDPEYGLYRVISLFSCKPWPITKMQTFPGTWDSYERMNADTGCTWDTELPIGKTVDSPLTLFFELPPGLPQPIFPLTFVIESDLQNIQNEYEGTAVVRSVEAKNSLFKDRVDSSGKPLVTTSRIQYLKTVTWEDYNTVDQGEILANGSLIVHARFVTITDLNQSVINADKTTIRVAGEYFGKIVDGDYYDYFEDTFQRQ